MTDPSQGPEISPESPWLGLNFFSEATCEYFFGREDEVRELFERVEHKPLTILFSQSGLGKTSLLQAGLIPRLREAGFLPVSLRLGYSKEDPPLVDQVFSNLRSSLQATGWDQLAEFPADANVSLWELFHDPAYGFIQSTGSSVVRPVLVLDQFEEVFTLGEYRRADSLAFRSMLAGLVENRPPDTLRARIEEDDELADRFIFHARPCKVLLALGLVTK